MSRPFLDSELRKQTRTWIGYTTTITGQCCCVRMDDDSCVMKLIEIVPVDNNRNCSESADVKFSPCHIKVRTYYILYL